MRPKRKRSRHRILTGLHIRVDQLLVPRVLLLQLPWRGYLLHFSVRASQASPLFVPHAIFWSIFDAKSYDLFLGQRHNSAAVQWIH